MDKKLLDYCMRNENKIRKGIKDAKDDRVHNGGGRTGISRPTEARAIFNLQPVDRIVIDGFVVIEKPQTVLLIISMIKEHFNHKRAGNIYYSRYVLKHKWYTTCKIFKWCDKNFYYKSVRLILKYGMEKVNEFGL